MAFLPSLARYFGSVVAGPILALALLVADQLTDPSSTSQPAVAASSGAPASAAPAATNGPLRPHRPRPPADSSASAPVISAPVGQAETRIRPQPPSLTEEQMMAYAIYLRDAILADQEVSDEALSPLPPPVAAAARPTHR